MVDPNTGVAMYESDDIINYLAKLTVMEALHYAKTWSIDSNCHLLHSCARGSPKRQDFFKKYGLFQAPYIEDPNTGVKMFESADIVEYLRATYAA
ncbi:hypothetical protein ZWY2020_037058 [Hordeum vulgare]|nr:hypothetical protein ZWY2020_037058 [Hordeum vulgare]